MGFDNLQAQNAANLAARLNKTQSIFMGEERARHGGLLRCAPVNF
jgi:hypothetical protein